MPKLPPPPRSAQNRSGPPRALPQFAVGGDDLDPADVVGREAVLPRHQAEAATEGVRDSADAGKLPESGASPCGAAASMTCCQVAPASIHAVLASGSTVTSPRRSVVMRTPPSSGFSVAVTLAFTAIFRPCSRANRTASWMS